MLKNNRMMGWMLLMSIFPMACSSPRNLEFLGYRRVEMTNPASGNGSLHLELQGFNPNHFKMQVKNARLNIFVNNQLLGNFLQDSQIEIPARDTFYFPLGLKFNFNNLLSNFLGINWGDSVRVKAIGKCDIGRKGIFFSFPVSYSTTRKWNIF
ncbi:MAG: LEA type 2 family protein [Chitinophagaceae bacterium]